MKTNKQIAKILIPIIAVLMMGSCINQEDEKNVILSFKYMSIVYDSSVTNFSFCEDPDYPNLVASYEVEKDHIISSLDLANIGQLTRFIPHNQGGYYTKTGYYSDYLNPLSGSNLLEGYVCSKDIIFYYSYIGGPAPIPEDS
ncbi:MAG: hypothetical protein WCZ47_03980 [Bacilli bacterium]|jgi:hypothetical protein|nr:hypothetical protein [Bacilli bacterium]